MCGPTTETQFMTAFWVVDIVSKPYWLHRKSSAPCAEDQSVDNIHTLKLKATLQYSIVSYDKATSWEPLYTQAQSFH